MGLKMMKDDYVYIVKTIDNTLVGVATSEDEAKHMIQQVMNQADYMKEYMFEYYPYKLNEIHDW